MNFPNIMNLSRLLLALLIVASAATLGQRAGSIRAAPAAQSAEQTQPEQRQASNARERAAAAARRTPSPSTAIDIPGGKLAYTATAGTLSLFDQSGERSAAIFYTAYVVEERRGGEPSRHLRVQRRPGRGLGLSCTWVWSDRGSPSSRATTRTAARLQDNPQTWLAFTDLVLIDPVGTGWSRPAKADGGGAFSRRAQRRRRSLAKTIALYLAEERPRQLAQIHPGRELRRLPRRQGGAGAAARAGHRGIRHRHGVAADRGRP